MTDKRKAEIKRQFWRIKNAWGININTVMLGMLSWLLLNKANAIDASMKQVAVNSSDITVVKQDVKGLHEQVEGNTKNIEDLFIIYYKK